MRVFMLIVLVMAMAMPSLHAQKGRLQEQLRYPRVREAKAFADSMIRAELAAKEMPYPPKSVYLRGLKSEAFLEVWVEKKDGRYGLFKKYPVCAQSGTFGPKVQQGDLQVPEGIYYLTRFNPTSTFFLSLKVGYPNSVDRKRSDGRKTGGDIYIHGKCVSVGCLAMTTPTIKELYWLCVLASEQGQARIPCHLFPSRLNKTKLAILELTYGQEHSFFKLWSPLAKVYQYFDEHKTLPKVNINASGEYIVE